MSAITPHGGPGLRAPAAAEDNGQVASTVELAADPTQALQPLIDGAPMATSATIGELAGALSAAQGDMSNPEKNRENPHFKSTYADLAAVLSVVRPAFAAHGLSLVQLPLAALDEMVMVSVILHASGEWIGMRMAHPIEGAGRVNSVQAVGIAITYLRRYSAASMAGVAQEDPDGAGALAAPASRANSDWRKRTSARNVQLALDELLPSLSPDAAAWAKGKAESAANVTELSAILASAERRLATYRAQQQPAAAPGTGREGPWLIGAAVAIGETDGNPEYGALLPPSVAVVPGDPVKVAMRGRQGRMRGVVTEVLDSTDEGRTVRTRKMTMAEETAVEERESWTPTTGAERAARTRKMTRAEETAVEERES